MGLSTPGQRIPQLPVRDSLADIDFRNDLWANPGLTPMYFSGPSANSIGAELDRLSLSNLSNTAAASSVGFTLTSFVLSWFETLDIEFSFYVPFFGDGGPSIFGVGLSTAAGNPCTTTGSMAQIRFGMGGPTCSGTVNAGVWNVLCGPVSNQVVITSSLAFELETWYTGRIEYRKNPKSMQFYVDDEALGLAITNPTNIPDTQSMAFRWHGACDALNLPDLFKIDYVRVSGTISR